MFKYILLLSLLLLLLLLLSYMCCVSVQVYEFRQYQLNPGYGSVPKLVAAFADG